MNIIVTPTTSPYWCSLPNTSNAKLGNAIYDTEEEATEAAQKRTEPAVAVLGTRHVMGVAIPHFVKLIEH
jgi:hypothetical protein